MEAPGGRELAPLDLGFQGRDRVIGAYLLDTEDGPVFLEVNPACDWLWSERLAGDRLVSQRVAELVSRRFEPAGSAAVPPAAPATDPGVAFAGIR